MIDRTTRQPEPLLARAERHLDGGVTVPRISVMPVHPGTPASEGHRGDTCDVAEAGLQHQPTVDTQVSRLDDVSRALYLRALAHRTIDHRAAAEELALPCEDVDAALRTLVQLRLLRRGDDEEQLVPVDPRMAAYQAATAFERNVRQYREEMNQALGVLRRLAGDYDAAFRADAATWTPYGLEVLHDPQAARNRLRLEAEQCHNEMITVQPEGAHWPYALPDLLSGSTVHVERGVTTRILCQHTVRTSLAMQPSVRGAVEAGAEVRTLAELTTCMLVFDRKVAFVPLDDVQDRSNGAVVITDRHLVRFLCSVHDRLWREAVPYKGLANGYQGKVGALEKSLLRGLATGEKDEVIARRLGMSVRTCRRRISALLQELGATSRFQAGVRAARLGWLDKPDGMVERER